MKQSKCLAFLLLAGLLFSVPAECSWIWSPDIGKWINPRKASKDTPEEQYDWALQFLNQKNWDRSIEEFDKLTETFPTSRLAAEAVYYTGVSWEGKGDPAKAADAYQKLVDKYPYSDRIKDAIKREFDIANQFASGGKVKMMGIAVLPGQDKAVELYNHIIKNAPFGTFGDQAQFKLGDLYKSQGEYELAQKAFQQVVDEYPSSGLVPKAKYEIANTSMLASKKGQFDEKHAEKAIEEFNEFKSAYPANTQGLLAEESIKQIRAEKADRGLSTASFYESRKKWKSARTYYEELVRDYPETPAAAEARKRLEGLAAKESGKAQSKFWPFG